MNIDMHTGKVMLKSSLMPDFREPCVPLRFLLVSMYYYVTVSVTLCVDLSLPHCSANATVALHMKLENVRF